MKIKTLGLILVSFCICSLALGQDVAFKVLANKGNNEVKNGATWQPLKTGASLKAGDELRLSENAYLALVHVETGRPKELKEPKVYKVAALAEEMSGGGAGVMHKYADFILTSSAEAQKNKLNATGAVTRDIRNKVELAVPRNQKSSVFNETVLIKWNSPVAGPYTVIVKNMFEDELARFETPESSITLQVNDERFGHEPILVQVLPNNDKGFASDAHMIEQLPAPRRQEIGTALEEIKGLVTSETAVSKFYLAGFYEQNGLVMDAISAYEQAIELAPDVTDYVESYNDFLIRHGLKPFSGQGQ